MGVWTPHRSHTPGHFKQWAFLSVCLHTGLLQKKLFPDSWRQAWGWFAGAWHRDWHHHIKIWPINHGLLDVGHKEGQIPQQVYRVVFERITLPKFTPVRDSWLLYQTMAPWPLSRMMTYYSYHGLPCKWQPFFSIGFGLWDWVLRFVRCCRDRKMFMC